MTNTYKNQLQRGFTVIELLIVIVVIGILAALVLNSFAGVQQRARDTERKTDISAVATHLEAYYNDAGAGKYPTLANLQDSSGWVTTNLKGLDLAALSAPGQTTNNITDTTTPTKDQYGYKPFNASNAACDNSTSNCVKFTLYYLKEDGNTVDSKASLNK